MKINEHNLHELDLPRDTKCLFPEDFLAITRFVLSFKPEHNLS